ncbi:hypothetical protein BN7_1536 [Wickerhamomyces ciferrii]|uniref:Zn(2)-C6 fungal-type domain-containing protein n=1 Tax=Wickerhamomyces ciferrii (strain ATCC 14091 / BCRC 22168 / CBS 111 / JCM 3599 / NBRC 0793 / NRRL Y-1031 F-60-10) TaxID=1206466 RepID=K0KII9_WICCF|nr:uncharacterized protein BN7_1536 [Wickerhamomyces ciferrii]CCH41997.1 hypothetical protein BN7_1536 [Wickerhamomyces ciferrii]
MSQPTVRQIHVPRAAKACAACRRQKTRCFPSNDGPSCLRCQSLSKPCSFITDGGPNNGGNGGGGGTNGNSEGPRLLPGGHAIVGGIKRTVSEAGFDIDFGALDQNVKTILSILQSKNEVPKIIENNEQVEQEEEEEEPIDDNTSISIPSFQTSPFNFLMNSISKQSLPNSIKSIMNPESITSKPQTQENVISLGIISQTDAQLLIDRFKNHYSRWISLPNNISSNEFIENLTENSPLFLTTIITTALRYHHPGNNSSSQPLRQALKTQLRKELINLIIQQNLKNLDDLKALVIISVYGYSLTLDNPDSTESSNIIDPWIISGIAIQKFLSYDIKTQLLNLDKLSTDQFSISLDEENSKLSNFRIWNHIALVHLVNCVFTSRSCLLDEIRLDQTRKSLDLSQATNFDGRIVSEI